MASYLNDYTYFLQKKRNLGYEQYLSSFHQGFQYCVTIFACFRSKSLIVIGNNIKLILTVSH